MTVIWRVVGFAAPFVVLILAMVVRQRSHRFLSPEQKLQMIDAFSQANTVHAAISVAILIGYGITITLGMFATWILIVFAAAFFAYQVLSHVAILKRLRSLDVPEEYRQSFHRQRLLTYLGFILLFAYLRMLIVGID